MHTELAEIGAPARYLNVCKSTLLTIEVSLIRTVHLFAIDLKHMLQPDERLPTADELQLQWCVWLADNRRCIRIKHCNSVK